MKTTAGAKVDDYVGKVEKAVEEGKINPLSSLTTDIDALH